MSRIISFLSLTLATAISATPPGDRGNSFDLTGLTLEELMDLEVFSAAKKQEKLAETAAPAFAITQEAIRRAGVTSIPEALRMVPGMEVARIDANKWAISARGFNSRFANKLLVLIDGRSVYTPLFSGVFWDTHDALLADVERIEVIRGPGATLWGANAVNGIINVLTRSARDTQGGLVTAGFGSEERGFGSVRYGGRLRDGLHYRIYAKYFNRDHSVDASGAAAADEWNMWRSGFRLDWDVADRDVLTLHGDLYRGEAGQTYRVLDFTGSFAERSFDFDAPSSGGHLLGRWERAYSEESDLALQLYYDRFKREEAIVTGITNTFDLDFQHRFAPGERQEIVWGLGYRFTDDQVDGTLTVTLAPASCRYDLFSAFVQNEISLVESRLSLMLGSKFEHNDFTGFELQPSVRLRWRPGERYTAWAAISRAVRTPSRADDDMQASLLMPLPGQPATDVPPILLNVRGDRDFVSEELLAFELGYRIRPTDRLFLDLAGFCHIYDELRTIEMGTPFLETSPPPAHLVVPAVMDNRMEGKTYGLELAANWRLRDWWRLRPAYTYLRMRLHLDADSKDTFSESIKGDSPRHQLSLWSVLDLPGAVELDLGFRYVDRLPNQDVDRYFSLDAHLGWRPSANLELSLVGQNLFAHRHSEFTRPAGLALPSQVTLPAEVQHGVYGMIARRF